MKKSRTPGTHQLPGTITIRIRRQTHHRLRRLADARGQGLPEYLDVLSRNAPVDAARILERIEDLLDARALAAATTDPAQKWVPLEQLDKDLDLTWNGKNHRNGAKNRGSTRRG